MPIQRRSCMAADMKDIGLDPRGASASPSSSSSSRGCARERPVRRAGGLGQPPAAESSSSEEADSEPPAPICGKRERSPSFQKYAAGRRGSLQRAANGCMVPTPPPPPRKVHQPNTTAKVFVGKLPITVKAEELVEAFAKFGSVTDCMVMNSTTNKDTTCAFVLMTSLVEAKRAVKELHLKLVVTPGRAPAVVQLASSNSQPEPAAATGSLGRDVEGVTMFAGKLAVTASPGALSALFGEFGEVLNVRMIGRRREDIACAFVSMRNISDGERAMEELNKRQEVDPVIGPMQVAFASGECRRLGLDPKQEILLKPNAAGPCRPLPEEQQREMALQAGQIPHQELVKVVNAGTAASFGFRWQWTHYCSEGWGDCKKKDPESHPLETLAQFVSLAVPQHGQEPWFRAAFEGQPPAGPGALYPRLPPQRGNNWPSLADPNAAKEQVTSRWRERCSERRRMEVDLWLPAALEKYRMSRDEWEKPPARPHHIPSEGFPMAIMNIFQLRDQSLNGAKRGSQLSERLSEQRAIFKEAWQASSSLPFLKVPPPAAAGGFAAAHRWEPPRAALADFAPGESAVCAVVKEADVRNAGAQECVGGQDSDVDIGEIDQADI